MVFGLVHHWLHVRKSVFGALALAAFFFSHVAAADYYYWKGATSTGRYASLYNVTWATGDQLYAAMETALQAYYVTESASNGTYNYQFTVTNRSGCNGTPTSITTVSCILTFTLRTYYDSNGNLYAINTGVTSSMSAASATSACNSSAAGQVFENTGSTGGLVDEYCDTNTGCKAVMVGVGVDMAGPWAANYKITTESCTTGSSMKAISNQVKGEKCITGGTSGATYCFNGSGTGNCGYVNDTYICIKTDVGESSCKTLHDGSRVCGSSAGTPPAPDSGTAGVKATADSTITATSGTGGPGGAGSSTTVNYYNSSTVNNSARDGSAADGSSDSSGSSGSASSGSSSSASSDGDCEDCEFAEPELEEVGEFAATVSAYKARVNAAPLMTAVTGIGSSIPAGECPSGTAEVFGKSITLDIHCTLWDDIAPVLSAVFLACWCFVGLRILMSA